MDVLTGTIPVIEREEVCTMLAAFMGQIGIFLTILFNILKLGLYVLAILALIKYLRTK